MKIRLSNPGWTHLPVLAVFIYFIIRLIGAGTLPAEAPVHFDIHGTPDSYGSPWLYLGLTLGLSLLFIGISFILDESWARQEKKKTFNWLNMFDEITVGFLVGTSAGYLDSLQSGSMTLVFPGVYAAVLAGGSALLAVVLELVRPFSPSPDQIDIEDTTGLSAELAARLKNKRPFIYWESQNPFYFNLLSIAVPLIMLIAALLSLGRSPWISLVVFLAGVVLFLFYGGMRITVIQREITVRFGFTGFKVLRLDPAAIAQAEIMSFSPLGDFGGWGIRYGRKNGAAITAFYLRGNRGVKVTTRQGKQYLIGSDKPEQLLSVIKAVTKIV